MWILGLKGLTLGKLPNLKVMCIGASEDIALQSCENLQTFVWLGASLCPPMQTSVKFRDFEELNLL